MDGEARRLADQRVGVRLDDSLPENAAVLELDGEEPVVVEWAIGSPARPMTRDQLEAKLTRLAGGRLNGLLDEPRVDAREVLSAAALGQAL